VGSLTTKPKQKKQYKYEKRFVFCFGCSSTTILPLCMRFSY